MYRLPEFAGNLITDTSELSYSHRLREPGITLKTLMDVGRAIEVAETQTKAIETQNERNSVSAVQNNKVVI